MAAPDDSYELARRQIFSDRIGICYHGGFFDELTSYDPDTDVPSWFRPGTEEALGDVDEYEAAGYTVGRSSSSWQILVTVGASLFLFLTQAKNLDEGLATVRRWGGRIRAWQRRFFYKADHMQLPEAPTLTVEALKVLALADLSERLGNDLEPVATLIRTTATCERSYDGAWSVYPYVYVFIPNKKLRVTHLITMNTSGDILNRTELPGIEFESSHYELLDRPLMLPSQTRDPAVEFFENEKREEASENGDAVPEALPKKPHSDG